MKDTAPPDSLPATGFVRTKLLLARFVPMGRTTLHEKIKAGTFPKPVRIGTRSVAFRVEDVRAWMEQPT